MRAHELTRTVTRDECSWLKKDIEKGQIVFLYTGPTYGCVTPGNNAFTYLPNQTPFFELPSDAVELGVSNIEFF
jgi:hypothetical protein